MYRPVAVDLGVGAQVQRGGGRGLVVCVAEAGAPVAEVGGDDEDVCGVGEVGGEEGAEVALRGGGGAAD